MKEQSFVRTIVLMFAIVFLFCAALVPVWAYALEYNRNATLVPVLGGREYPGVYSVTAIMGDKNATLGIPSIAKQNLTSPTVESPAIIMGAAVPYERLVEPTIYEKLNGGELYPPYSYFRYEILEERDATGNTHRKMSGFDGSYVIIRVDVSELIRNAPEGSYLHVRQKGNKALMVSLQHNVSEGAATFSDANGNKTGSYSLANNAAALKDKSGSYMDKPYLDVIIMSSGTNVAGADTGNTDPTIIQADFTLEFYVDQTKEYNNQIYPDPNFVQTTNGPTLDQVMIAKYYDENTTATVTSYTVKGSDLELETTVDDLSPRKFWSLRQSMEWEEYYNHPIKLICEVPVLIGLRVDGTGKSVRPYVILNVNSFDIQIANHQSKNDAALTVKNATLKLIDGFTTTGSELAVGNNATMSIQTGGKLIIDESCQLEVEYDAASTAQTEPSATPASGTDLTNGLITIEDGGEIENNGVITIEGTEGKPIDVQTAIIRDKKDAVLIINKGGKLTNNGCLLSYGELYNMGTLVNNGRYTDLIQSRDTDKGKYTYHRGIQISWKDDVTQDSVFMGSLYNGQGQNEAKNPDAQLINNGDIVLVPGILENLAVFENRAGGNVYVCPVEEAIIPIIATVSDPLVREKRVRFGQPHSSYLTNYTGASMTNAGNIAGAKVEIVSNGRTGTLTPLTSGDRLMTDLDLNNLGKLDNSGTITLNSVNTFNEMTNSGMVNNKIILKSNNELKNSVLYDRAVKKLTEIYNATLTRDGDTNIWRHAPAKKLTVTPSIQKGTGGGNVIWTIKAETDNTGSDIEYMVEVYQTTISALVQMFPLKANQEMQITSPVLPQVDGNVVYNFYISDYDGARENATVQVTSTDFTVPGPIEGLVYNGKEQLLTATGYSYKGEMEYRLGTDGAWSRTVPVARNAGTYQVYYRVAGESEARGFVEAVIARRPVAVSAIDLASPVGQGALHPTPPYTLSGLAESDKDLSGVQVSANPDTKTLGRYPISVTVTGSNPNYEVYTYDGTYTVTNGISLTAKDTYGVFGTTGPNGAAYAGYNIEVTVSSGVTVYYSMDAELNSTNYNTVGAVSLQDLPATARKWHVVYYYATYGNGDAVSGHKLVVIEKAQQQAPTNVTAQSEPKLNYGNGVIGGLTPRTMEYRNKYNNGKYATVYYEYIIVIPGIYLVRYAGDDDHYPSPDCEVIVGKGEPVIITFDSNGGSPVADVRIAVGELVPRPADPIYTGYVFLGWFKVDNTLFNFNKSVNWDMTLTAHWRPEYVYTEGQGAVWTRASGMPLQFTIKQVLNLNQEYDKFVSLKVDRKVINSPAEYDKMSGSLILRLKPTYLETLSDGRHILTAEFNDSGIAETDFTIVSPETIPVMPDTGDRTMHPLVYVVLGALAIIGIIILRRKR